VDGVIRRLFARGPRAGASTRRGERGVALVEAAFVTPVFFMLIFGIVEGGLYMNDYLGVSSSVRAAARTASANGAIAQADMYTLVNFRREAAALSDQQIQYVVVYKASTYGAQPTTTCKAGTSVANVCNVYRMQDIKRAEAQAAELDAQEAAESAGQSRTLDESKIWFGCLTSGPHANQSPDRYWCPAARTDTRSGNGGSGPDYVGVYVQANHPWMTKMFGNSTTVRDQSVIQIEPRAE